MFLQYLTDQSGQFVQVERSGPDACQGWVLNVAADYLTLHCCDGTLLHLPLHHIRSVTPLPSPGPEYTPPTPPIPQWPATFAELLSHHLGQRVQLYHAGPEVTVGTLLHSAEEYVLLEVEPGYQVCHTRFHLRSLCLVPDYDPWPGEAGLSIPPENPAQ